MKTRILAVAMLGATAIAGCGAIAQTAATPGDQTRADYLAKAGERFDRLDANRDGRLTREERRAGRTDRKADRAKRRGDRGMRGDGRMERMDLDNDGRISRQEATQASADRINRMFARADRNSDGFIDGSERPQRPGADAPAADMDGDEE